MTGLLEKREMKVEEYHLDPNEVEQILALNARLSADFETCESESFLERAYLHSSLLPDKLKQAICRLRYEHSHNGIFVIRGFTLGKDVPKTPASWHPENCEPSDRGIDYLAILLSSLLGEPFGFETQQQGKLIHDITPIKGKEYEQAGYSSLAELSFHTEDAFHPHRGEFLGFYCMRNPVNTGTLIVPVGQLNLPDNYKNTLFEKRFYTVPDNTHETEVGIEPHSIFYGNRTQPYSCIDFDFTFALDGDEEADKALSLLKHVISDNAMELNFTAGDFCFIDNRKWVHGRKPFTPRFDGEDRWLRRVNITTNLRKSVGYRKDVKSRLLESEYQF